MALLATNVSPAQTYSAVNTILVVVGTLLLIGVTIFFSLKVTDRRAKRQPEDGVDQPQRRSGE
jgi:hypothetical protein